MIQLLVASSNKGKLRDFAAAAGGHVSIVPLPGLDAIAAPAEDELTFEGNATVKAVYYSRFAPGEIVIADDSGLEVDALDGAPGVRSARYADDCGFMADATVDERNNLCLVAALRDVSSDQRQGRYRCVLVAARDGQVVAIGSGAVEGIILAEPQGSGGFGYDPFFLPQGETKSMAELDMETRMSLSHRGRALGDLLAKLRDANTYFSR
jgi:XTP/dITP diphosphohydrolase